MAQRILDIILAIILTSEFKANRQRNSQIREKSEKSGQIQKDYFECKFRQL